MNIKDLISSLNLNITEEDATQIAEAFDTAVNAKATEQVQLQVESALKTQDEEHAEKLNKVLEAVDKDHAKKAEHLIQTLNENHAEKLKLIIKRYNKLISEKANSFSKKMVNEVSSFLDLYIERAIPQAQLDEAVKNTLAVNKLHKLREFLSIGDDLLAENNKKVLAEGRKQLEELNSKLNEQHKNTLLIEEKLRKSESSLLLEQKTKGMAIGKKSFVVKLLEDKETDYIEENFEFVVEMFERDEVESESRELESNSKNSVALQIKKVPTVINESQKEAGNEPTSGYLTELKRIDGKKV